MGKKLLLCQTKSLSIISQKFPICRKHRFLALPRSEGLVADSLHGAGIFEATALPEPCAEGSLHLWAVLRFPACLVLSYGHKEHSTGTYVQLCSKIVRIMKSQFDHVRAGREINRYDLQPIFCIRARMSLIRWFFCRSLYHSQISLDSVPYSMIRCTRDSLGTDVRSGTRFIEGAWVARMAVHLLPVAKSSCYKLW